MRAEGVLSSDDKKRQNGDDDESPTLEDILAAVSEASGRTAFLFCFKPDDCGH